MDARAKMIMEEIKTFCVGYIFALIAIFVLAAVLGYFFDYQPSAGLGFVASFTGALWAGQNYAMKNNAKPPSRLSWQFAFVSFVPAFIISVVVIALIGGIAGFDVIVTDAASIPLNFWFIGLGLTIVLHILAARFFFSFGAGNHLNAEANRQKK